MGPNFGSIFRVISFSLSRPRPLLGDLLAELDPNEKRENKRLFRYRNTWCIDIEVVFWIFFFVGTGKLENRLKIMNLI